jgi:hypothetical protein
MLGIHDEKCDTRFLVLVVFSISLAYKLLANEAKSEYLLSDIKDYATMMPRILYSLEFPLVFFLAFTIRFPTVERSRLDRF